MGYPKGKGSSGSSSMSRQQGQGLGEEPIVPKPERLDFDFPEDALYAPPWHAHVWDTVASSSSSGSSNVRSFFIGMGFSPSLVDKVIQDKGEDDADLLLETLMDYSDGRMAGNQPSNYMDGFFGERYGAERPQLSTYIQPKEEPDVFDEELVDKRASLLMMKFNVNEVEFALDKLGEDTPINELVDFIAAAQIAEQLENESEDSLSNDEGNDQNIPNETLFGTMEKTLQLLEMGFSENEVSIAIEKFGSEVPTAELADSIFTGLTPPSCTQRKKLLSTANTYDTIKIETENCSANVVPQERNISQGELCKGKRPKEENFDDPVSLPQYKQSIYEEKHKGKRPKLDNVDDTSSFLDPAWFEEKVDPNMAMFETPRAFKSISCKSVDKMVAKPPYFLYGNVLNLPYDFWAKISPFLYGIEPEIVNTQFFSALTRREGYIHNLPAGTRFHILPKSPLTIQDAIPHTKKWWPSWDTRKQLSSTRYEVVGVSKHCDRLGRILADSQGLISPDQQNDILRHCQVSNLIWVGLYKLAIPEPEHWEHILGYPLNHTQPLENYVSERIRLLKQSFQIDTLGYYLSVLKPMFPGGLTVLSIFSGIGGGVITLHRLGIHLKGVVSIETCEARQRILKNWWHSSGQTGELVLIEDIQKLTSKKLESLSDKFGGFDFVICQNSDGKYVIGRDDGKMPGFDFTLFHEFVRVLQRVRSMMGRRS